MNARLVGIAILLNTVPIFSFGPHTFFAPRSQALNAVRDLVGTQRLIPRQYPDADLWPRRDEKECDMSYFVLSTAVEYNRSFKPSRMSQYLFGCNPCMTFSGSRVPYRAATDILADYFGLPQDFQSTVSFEPRISNAILDFNAFLGLDDWIPGLYFNLHVPLVHTRWDLELCEKIQDKGSDFFPAGYMGPTRINRDQLPASVTQALAGNTRFGDMNDPLRFGKVCGAQKLTCLSEIHVMLGWNYVGKETWHAGLALRSALRTPGVSTAQYLFEPIVGNCGHFELGASITSHWDFWQRDDHKLAAYLDANVTHLFGSTQMRSFDLNNGNGSRYMLLEHFNAPAYNLQNASDVPPSSQYQGGLTPAINQTTLATKTSFSVQGDVVLKFAYHYKHWEFDLGYDFFGRSAEKASCRQTLPGNLFAIKGDAQIYGFITNIPTPMSASQSNATINAGQGATNFAPSAQFDNANADNPELAFNSGGTNFDQLNLADRTDLNITSADINSSFNPILLTDANINVCSGLMPRAISNKFFVNVTYIWEDVQCIIPYACAGASGEWASGDALKNSTDSQWAVWVKGGITY